MPGGHLKRNAKTQQERTRTRPTTSGPRRGLLRTRRVSLLNSVFVIRPTLGFIHDMHREIIFTQSNPSLASLPKYFRLAPRRDETPVEPPLHGRRILVAEQARCGDDTAEPAIDHMFSLGKGLMLHGRIYTPKAYTRQTWKAYTRNANLAA